MIIRATTSHLEDIIELMELFYSEEGYPFNRENTIHNLNIFLENDSLGSIYLYQEQNQFVAYTVLVNTFCFELGGKVGYIDELFVKSLNRGNKIATNLLEYIILISKLNKIATLRLEVEKLNYKASMLYESFGFLTHKRNLMSLPLK